MDQKATASLLEDMKRFFSFVQDINKALSKRIGHAAKLQEFVGISRELHDKSVQSIDLDLKNNLSFGELCSGILNTAVLLNINILRQKEIINSLKISRSIDKKIEKRLMYKILILSESVQKSLRLIQGILDNNNEMILLDNQLMNRRKLLRPKVDEFSALLKKIQDFINSDLREYNTGAKQKSAAEDLLLGAAGIFESMDREGLAKLTESIRNESRDEEQLSSKLSLRMDTVDQLHQKALELFRDSSAIKNLLEIRILITATIVKIRHSFR